MLMNYSPANFRRTANFGNFELVENRNTGSKVKKFIKTATLHFYEKKKTLSQQYQLTGTELDNTVLIIIKHTHAIDGCQAVEINGMYYNVIEYSPDDTTLGMAYDYITIRKQSKGV